MVREGRWMEEKKVEGKKNVETEEEEKKEGVTKEGIICREKDEREN